MKKIFLDLGAWKGTATQFFIRAHPQAKEFEYYLFEPHPNLIEHFLFKLPQLNDYKIWILPNAVWSRNTELDFYVGKSKYARGNTLLDSKTSGNLNKEHPIKIKALDISQFIKNNFKPDDYIICKSNIEGAEYEILPNMIANGSLSYINKLYIAWHWNKIDYKESLHNSIVEHVKKYTTVFDWILDEDENSNLISKKNQEWFLKTLEGDI